MRLGAAQRRKPADVPSSGLPTVAAITMTRDEGAMLGRWVRFYADALGGPQHLLVFDDNSADGSTDDLDCAVYHLPQLPGIGGYERTRTGLMSGIAGGLLEVYDFVIFADVDEFLIPDPAKFSGLREFLAERRDRDVIAPVTLNVVQHVDVEPPIDPDRPILDQRSFAKFVPIMCKPSIKRVPARWTGASHAVDAPFEIDPALFMLHLKFYDIDALRIMAGRRNAMVQADGRATKSNWSRSADEVVSVGTQATRGVDPAGVPEFDPTPSNLAGIVQQRGGVYRATGQGQIQAMTARPLVRIPERLRGLL